MVLDPKSPERGIYESSFELPSGCSCSAPKKMKKKMKKVITPRRPQPSPFLGTRKQSRLTYRTTTLAPINLEDVEPPQRFNEGIPPIYDNSDPDDKYTRTFPRTYLKGLNEDPIDRKWSPSSLSKAEDEEFEFIPRNNEPYSWRDGDFKRKNSYSKPSLSSLSLPPTLPPPFTDTPQRRRVRPQIHRLQDKYRAHLLKINADTTELPTTIQTEATTITTTISTTTTTAAAAVITEVPPDSPSRAPPISPPNKRTLADLLRGETDPIKIRSIIANYKENRLRPPTPSPTTSTTTTTTTTQKPEPIEPVSFLPPISAPQLKKLSSDIEKEEEEDDNVKGNSSGGSLFSELNYYKNRSKYRRLGQNDTKILSSIQNKYAYKAPSSTESSAEETTSTTTPSTRAPFIPTMMNRQEAPLFIIENEEVDDAYSDQGPFSTPGFPSTTTESFFELISFETPSPEQLSESSQLLTSLFDNDIPQSPSSRRLKPIQVKKPIRNSLNVFDELRLSFGFR